MMTNFIIRGVSFSNFRQFAFRLFSNDALVLCSVGFLCLRLKVSEVFFPGVKTWKKVNRVVFIFSSLLQTDLRANCCYIDQRSIVWV